MVLSNGTLQINNFRDHTKMILCPLLGALTTLGSTKAMRTYKLASMEKGLSNEMYDRLKYALEKVNVIIERGLADKEAGGDTDGSCDHLNCN
jgi:polo-like kinase 1